MRQKILLTFALLLILAQGTWAFSGSGTSESPYLIACASDWSTLASNVNSGTNYVGKSFRLTNDISVTTMVGSSESNSFRGTFDGYGHTLTINYNTTSDYTAPFRYIQGATFKNLKVTGSITTTMNLAAGIAGLNTGATATFEQCVTDVAITSSSTTIVGWGRVDYHGGLLARTNNVDVNITDCFCGGSVNGSNSSTSISYGAGLVGVAVSCTVTATRCLCTTSYTNVTIWNSLCHTAEATRSTSDFYFVYGNDAANAGTQVTTSQLADGSLITDLQDGRSTTVWVQYAGQPMLNIFAFSKAADGYYLIGSEQEWRNFASLILTIPTANARMTADISVTTMVGNSDSNSFSGTFDGQGHTLTVDYSGNDYETRSAPFSYVKGATIKNLIVIGNCGTAGRAAGIVGECSSLSTVTNCVSSVTISGGPYVGGISIGGHYHIEGCLFNGTINGTSDSGGFVGYGENDTQITNCVFAPQAESSISGGTFYHTGSGGATVTNSYYMTLCGNAQGKQTRNIEDGEDVTISGLGAASATYDVSGITAYAHGIKYNDVFYAGNGDAVSLTLSHTDKAGSTFSHYSVTGGGTLIAQTETSATLTMTDANQTINVRWGEDDPAFPLTGSATLDLSTGIYGNTKGWEVPSYESANKNIGYVREGGYADGYYVYNGNEAAYYSFYVNIPWFKNSGTFTVTITDVATGATEATATSPTITGLSDMIFTIDNQITAGVKKIRFDFHSTNPELNDHLYNINNVSFCRRSLTDGECVTVLSAFAGKQCDLIYSRSFTIGKPSTVCLPFAYTKKEGDGSFYAFTGITKKDGKYEATMTEPISTTLTANTPYLYMPSTTGDADFSGTYTIPATLEAGTTTSGDWTFVGTYTTVSWTEAPTGIYGFSAQNVDEQGISQGEFVKVGAYVRVKPMRCYLMYKNGGKDYAGARSMNRAPAEETLPETISVRLVNANGDVTAIGTLHTQTGEVTLDDGRWYTLDGTRLSGQPTRKGIYVNNGKKVVIK